MLLYLLSSGYCAICGYWAAANRYLSVLIAAGCAQAAREERLAAASKNARQPQMPRAFSSFDPAPEDFETTVIII
mgnify:CR=1 FL=1